MPQSPLDSQTENAIVCRGIRTHNLKNIDLKISLHKWTAVTGVSGSGKSSLVFDTLYAEAQRRFLETLGTYERQFLQGLPQGEFEEIEPVPAAVALKQTNRSSDPRSLIGTTADLMEPLRVLFTALMESSCARCGSQVESHRPGDLMALIVPKKTSPSGEGREEKRPQTYLLSVPFAWQCEGKKRAELAKNLLLEGYLRVAVAGEVVHLEEALTSGALASLPEDVEIILDRISSSTDLEEIQNRIETVWSQVRFSPRFSRINVATLQAGKTGSKPIQSFMVQPFCSRCQTHTTLIQASDLDWQSVLGACSTCKGLGNIPVVDANKVIPNPQLSLEEGAIKPWNSETFAWMREGLVQACKANGVKTKVPYGDLDTYTRTWIWSGNDPEKRFSRKRSDLVNLNEFFATLENERYKRNSRILLAKYRKYVQCSDCGGLRLGQAGRNAVTAGKHYFELLQDDIEAVHAWARRLPELPALRTRFEAVRETYDEVVKKLSLLVRLGLGSSALGRRCKTLSGGEYQRVLLTRVLGNGLTDALYVLDEPSVGLGKAEIPELIACLEELRDLGNTVVMVEHDPDLIKAADEWIELGPGGGTEGGQVLPRKSRLPISLVAQSNLPEPPVRQIVSPDAVGSSPLSKKGDLAKNQESLELRGFSMLNCHDLDITIPMGRLTVITGPSGAGKSTLVYYGLAAALELLEDSGQTSNAQSDADEGLGSWKELVVPRGFLSGTRIVSVAQKAMHRSVTSVVATVLGIMDGLRRHFASTEGARELGLSASDFSFNGAGACETCHGNGTVRDDLFFLGEVEKTCPDCQGSRYRADVHAVQWHGKTISSWLGTNLRDCVIAWKNYPALSRPLSLAIKLGLGHLPLGVATSALSGGEAQRLRICAALTKGEGAIFCILDEPTRGLSEKDNGELLEALLQLCSQGHTFVVVEHHEHFQRFAHQLIRMGPGAGIHGGRIVERELRH